MNRPSEAHLRSFRITASGPGAPARCPSVCGLTLLSSTERTQRVPFRLPHPDWFPYGHPVGQTGQAIAILPMPRVVGRTGSPEMKASSAIPTVRSRCARRGMPQRLAPPAFGPAAEPGDRDRRSMTTGIGPLAMGRCWIQRASRVQLTRETRLDNMKIVPIAPASR